MGFPLPRTRGRGQGEGPSLKRRVSPFAPHPSLLPRVRLSELAAGGGEGTHFGCTAVTKLNFLFFTCTTTIGFSAFRSPLIVIAPATPGKPLVDASASRTALWSVLPARLIASTASFI